MEDGLVHRKKEFILQNWKVLILIVVDNGLVLRNLNLVLADEIVLILIVVDNGLVRATLSVTIERYEGLNPYCSRQWSRTG